MSTAPSMSSTQKIDFYRNEIKESLRPFSDRSNSYQSRTNCFPKFIQRLQEACSARHKWDIELRFKILFGKNTQAHEKSNQFIQQMDDDHQIHTAELLKGIEQAERAWSDTYKSEKHRIYKISIPTTSAVYGALGGGIGSLIGASSTVGLGTLPAAIMGTIIGGAVGAVVGEHIARYNAKLTAGRIHISKFETCYQLEIDWIKRTLPYLNQAIDHASARNQNPNSFQKQNSKLSEDEIQLTELKEYLTNTIKNHQNVLDTITHDNYADAEYFQRELSKASVVLARSEISSAQNRMSSALLYGDYLGYSNALSSHRFWSSMRH